jgi:3-deoxy-D-manno-octulosonic acid kinase
VPDGIHLRVAGGEVLAFLPGYEVAVREVAAHPDALPAAGLGGRGGLSRVLTAEVPVLVREYRKGGMLRALRGARFHGSWRPLEELVLLRRLRAVGVPAPEAVGCVVLRRPLGWRGFLLTQEVEGAVDLEAWLHGVRAPTRRPRRELLREAGRSVRMLHDAGVLHPDLHPKNLLLTPEGGVLVLDLDGARTGDGLVTDGGRVKNLVRLARAVEKHRLKGLRAGRREALRFLEGYSGSREAAEAWLDRVRQRLRRGLALRILWWRLIGEARPWRPAVG